MLGTVEATRTVRRDTVYRTAQQVIALRFRYDPALKDAVKAALHASHDATGDFPGTWDAEAKFWWVYPEAWAGVARRLRQAGVTVVDMTGARGFDAGPEPEREARREQPKAPPKHAPHEVLGVSPRATTEEIKAAYLALVKQWQEETP